MATRLCLTRARLTPEELKEIMRSPAMQQIGDAILDLSSEARNNLASNDANMP